MSNPNEVRRNTSRAEGLMWKATRGRTGGWLAERVWGRSEERTDAGDSEMYISHGAKPVLRKGPRRSELSVLENTRDRAGIKVVDSAIALTSSYARTLCRLEARRVGPHADAQGVPYSVRSSYSSASRTKSFARVGAFTGGAPRSEYYINAPRTLLPRPTLCPWEKTPKGTVPARNVMS